jgi:hypothetical protein
MVAATEKTRTDIRFGVTIDSPDAGEQQPSALLNLAVQHFIDPSHTTELAG